MIRLHSDNNSDHSISGTAGYSICIPGLELAYPGVGKYSVWNIGFKPCEYEILDSLVANNAKERTLESRLGKAWDLLMTGIFRMKWHDQIDDVGILASVIPPVTFAKSICT